MSDPEGLFAIVEVMGRRTRAGRISDASLGGATLLRIEHPSRLDHTGEGPFVEYYSPQALFAIRPCSRDDAEKVATWAWPAPQTTQALSPAFDDVYDEDDE